MLHNYSTHLIYIEAVQVSEVSSKGAKRVRRMNALRVRPQNIQHSPSFILTSPTS